MKSKTKFVLIIILFILAAGSLCCNGKPDQNAQTSTGSKKEITIASWNLKNFGLAKLNDAARINVIISVLEKYDIIAIQEAEDASLTLPALLIGKINSDGKNYMICSPELGPFQMQFF